MGHCDALALTGGETATAVHLLIEAFRDDEDGGAHVKTEHFKKATAERPAYLTRTPDIVNVTVDGWSQLGELAVKYAPGSLAPAAARRGRGDGGWPGGCSPRT